MALSTKIIRGRIRSMRNTRKVTKAMELVSASKMRRAVASVIQSRSYSETAWKAVLNLSRRVSQGKHPLLAQHKKNKRSCFFLLTSNRGLCGGFNSHILNKSLHYAQNLGMEIEWIVMGKKGADILARSQKKVIADFPRPDVVTGASDISAPARFLIEGFVNETYDRVYVAYTDFVSAMAQKPRVKLFLPFALEQELELGEVGTHIQKPAEEPFLHEEYLFEPNAKIILEFFLKKLMEVQLYQALLESAASEHAARMIAMRQASDAAQDMIDDLTLAYNQARQAAITREIAEISSGKAALNS